MDIEWDGSCFTGVKLPFIQNSDTKGIGWYKML